MLADVVAAENRYDIAVIVGNDRHRTFEVGCTIDWHQLGDRSAVLGYDDLVTCLGHLVEQSEAFCLEFAGLDSRNHRLM